MRDRRKSRFSRIQRLNRLPHIDDGLVQAGNESTVHIACTLFTRREDRPAHACRDEAFSCQDADAARAQS